uniref:Uncharacterized protein n=1 Tax=Glossina palpalis gambiensis TaxID=67801 RepID=A0A1B0B510_9MUSC
PFRSYHHCYPVPSSSPLLFSPIPALPPSFLFPFEWYICVVMPRVLCKEKKRKEKKSTPFSRVKHDFIDYIEFPLFTSSHIHLLFLQKRKIELKELEKGNKMRFVWHKLCKKSGVIAFRSKG